MAFKAKIKENFSILSNPLMLAFKCALAVFLALFIGQFMVRPDNVSSAFVAVLCVSPIVLIGLRRAFSQFAGSIVGGSWATLATLLHIPILYGIPLSVGLSIITVIAISLRMGYPIAAFTAIFVQVIPLDGPLDALVSRLVAVGIGAFSGFTVNSIVSAAFYSTIFDRRFKVLEIRMNSFLNQAIEHGPERVRQGFPLIQEFQKEINLALEELKWRKSNKTYKQIKDVDEKVTLYEYLFHLILDLDYLRQQRNLPKEEVRLLLQDCLSTSYKGSAQIQKVQKKLKDQKELRIFQTCEKVSKIYNKLQKA